MRIEVNGIRLFFDVDGAKLAPDGRCMRERPTLILLLAALRPGIGRITEFEHCGHGAWCDHPDRALQVIRDFVLS